MRRAFYIRISVFFGFLSGLAVAGGIRVSGQTTAPEADRFEAGAGVHETHADAENSVQLPNMNELLPEREAFLPPAPTRSSFMATWESVSGAKGYLLDVSTSSAFDGFVDGYHDLDVGDVNGRVVTGLTRGTTYYYRVRPYDVTGVAGYMETMASTTELTTGLTIHPTFDSSITNNSNAAAIEAMISRAISLHESLFRDPITIQIRFRYSTTGPDGHPMSAGSIAQSDFVIYTIPWNTFISALRADASTANDNFANVSLPGSALSSSLRPSSANGRAVGLNTPPAMFANGTVGNGGPYDGIVTLNSAVPYKFSRPTSSSTFDAQRSLEHEMDEVIGLGSRLNVSGSNLRPQDLFSWSSAGHRNITSSGTRYFSINGGVTNIVNFNHDSNGDFGDWLSQDCPQSHPYVQNAFSCRGQFSDVTATTPEGINLDVIGYDLSATASSSENDFNNDGHPDFLLFNAMTQQTMIWYLNNHTLIGSASAPTLPSPWQVAGVADFNHDGHPDYLLFNPATRRTVIWHMNNNVHVGGGAGPTLPSGWSVVALSDFNQDGFPDYLLYNADTHRTVVWYMRDNDHFASNNGPAIPGGWSIVAAADFNGDGDPDFVLFRASTGQSVIWYLSGLTRTGSRSGPTIPAGYALEGVADFNGNGQPDFLLYNSGNGRTVIWYMNDNIRVGSASGPTLPGGWSLAAP